MFPMIAPVRDRLIRLCVLVCLAAVAISARAESDAPRLLVASPSIRSSNYAQTVIVTARRPAGGHVGVILNRPSRRPLISLFPEHPPSGQVREPVFYGGPFASSAIVAVAKSPVDLGDGAIRITPGLYFVFGENLIDRVIETTPNEARYYLGYVAWRPGELDREIAQGWWKAHDADIRTVFRSDAGRLWEEMHQRSNSLRVEASTEGGAGSNAGG